MGTWPMSWSHGNTDPAWRLRISSGNPDTMSATMSDGCSVRGLLLVTITKSDCAE